MHERDVARVDSQPLSGSAELPQRPTETVRTTAPETKIVHGIEFFRIRDEEDCQCARCGSSCFFRNCDNCGGEGYCEDDDWQWPSIYDCDWCQGKGGWWRCISSKAFCEANPMPGREGQPVMGCESHEYED